MSKLLESVDQRTQLVGENRLELLMFRLRGKQLFALNVFKIQEVVKMPPLNEVPQRHPVVCGVTHMRGQTLPVIDLSRAIRRGDLNRPIEERNLIVTEYNRTVQGFLVGPVDRIVNLNWDLILPPPSGTGASHYLTAITKVDDQIVEILDVERVLADIVPSSTQVSAEVLDPSLLEYAANFRVLIVDDSPTAINQASETVKQVGSKVAIARNGQQGLDQLKRWVQEGVDVNKDLLMVITDAEMPEMDGYRLTSEIRSDPNLKDLYVVLHTSLSGSFNNALAEKVGCDNFLSKFSPDELAVVVQEQVRARKRQQGN